MTRLTFIFALSVACLTFGTALLIVAVETNSWPLCYLGIATQCGALVGQWRMNAAL